MPEVNTGNTTIAFGSTLRIGYRLYGSAGPYTYLTYFPSYNELPYTFELDLGTWQVEYSTICPNCAGSIYSDPKTYVISVS